MMPQNTPETKRLFIGGLFNGATPEELKERFRKYGIVKSVDLKTKKNDIGEVINTFAFIDFNSTPDKLRQCIDVFNKSKWKGKELNIQLAKENFLDRLAKERKSQSVVKLWSPEKSKVQVALSLADDNDDESKLKIEQPARQLDNRNSTSKLNAWTLSKKEKKKKKQVITQKPSSGSDSDSDSEVGLTNCHKRNHKTNVTLIRENDSDCESRDSCDTDEIIRCAKGGKYASTGDDYVKIQEVRKSLDTPGLNLGAHTGVTTTTTRAFSEFDDGFSTLPPKKKELANENDDEDVFDLIKSGKIEKLLEVSGDDLTSSLLDSPTKRTAQESNVSKKFNDSKHSEVSKKRKRSDLENPVTKAQKVDSSEEKQTGLKEGKKRLESVPLDVSRKRKRSQLEEEKSAATQSENQNLTESSVANETSSKRKRTRP